MSRNSEIDDATLLEYLDGALNAKARAAVEAALTESPELSERLRSLRALMPLVAAALDNEAAPVPPPSWAAIRKQAQAPSERCGDPSAFMFPPRQLAQAPAFLVLMGSVVIAAVSLLTFFVDRVAALMLLCATIAIAVVLEQVRVITARHAEVLNKVIITAGGSEPTQYSGLTERLRRIHGSWLFKQSRPCGPEDGLDIALRLSTARLSSLVVTLVRVTAILIQICAAVAQLAHIIGWW